MIGLLVQYKVKGFSPGAAARVSPVSPEVTAWIRHDHMTIRHDHWQDKCILWFAQRRMAVAPVHFSPRIPKTSEQTVDMLYNSISWKQRIKN